MNLILPIYSLLLLAFLQILFYSKKRINNFETKIYKNLMIISTLNIIYNIIGIYLGYNGGNIGFLVVLNHLDLPLYIWWASTLLLYLFIAQFGDRKYPLLEKSMVIIASLITIATIFLPIEVIITDKAGFAKGLCVDFVYALSFIYILLCFVMAFVLTFNKKTTRSLLLLKWRDEL